jgi:uncharacterized membrane protein
MAVVDSVTPKAAAKHDLLFNNQTFVSGLLNKGSCLARVFGLTKFIKIRDMILVTLCCAAYVGLRCSTNPPLASGASFNHLQGVESEI